MYSWYYKLIEISCYLFCTQRNDTLRFFCLYVVGSFKSEIVQMCREMSEIFSAHASRSEFSTFSRISEFLFSPRNNGEECWWLDSGVTIAEFPGGLWDSQSNYCPVLLVPLLRYLGDATNPIGGVATPQVRAVSAEQRRRCCISDSQHGPQIRRHRLHSAKHSRQVSLENIHHPTRETSLTQRL